LKLPNGHQADLGLKLEEYSLNLLHREGQHKARVFVCTRYLTSTGAALTLHRGQMGTVVMTYDGSAFDVEFSDDQGRAFAIMPIRGERLIVLHDAPRAVAA